MGRKKMTMAEWEKSPMDARADKSGRHGKEGSPKDRAADERELKTHNARRDGLRKR